MLLVVPVPTGGQFRDPLGVSFFLAYICNSEFTAAQFKRPFFEKDNSLNNYPRWMVVSLAVCPDTLAETNSFLSDCLGFASSVIRCLEKIPNQFPKLVLKNGDFSHPMTDPWDCYIYLHECLIFMVKCR